MTIIIYNTLFNNQDCTRQMPIVFTAFTNKFTSAWKIYSHIFYEFVHMLCSLSMSKAATAAAMVKWDKFFFNLLFAFMSYVMNARMERKKKCWELNKIQNVKACQNINENGTFLYHFSTIIINLTLPLLCCLIFVWETSDFHFQYLRFLLVYVLLLWRK